MASQRDSEEFILLTSYTGMLIAFSAYLLEKRQAMQTKQPSDDTSSFTVCPHWISCDQSLNVHAAMDFGQARDQTNLEVWRELRLSCPITSGCM